VGQKNSQMLRLKSWLVLLARLWWVVGGKASVSEIFPWFLLHQLEGGLVGSTQVVREKQRLDEEEHEN
jgi:hypothetical protein